MQSNSQNPVNIPGDAHVSVHEAPTFAWSFDETDAFSFELTNHALAELADPVASRELRYTADLYRDGEWLRRVAVAPLAGPVPIGGQRVFNAHLGISAIGGDYDLRFGLSRGGDDLRGMGVQVPIQSTAAPLRVKNQIMEAFVELINACNFKCTFCPQTTLRRKQEAMDFDLATKVVGDLAEMGHHYPIMVHLMGEPLLYPRFFEFVERTHDMGQRIHLLTNGSRFKEETISELFRTGVDELLISLNTPEKALYDAQRGTNMPYDTYMAGIRRMVEEVVRRGPPPMVLIQILYYRERADQPEEMQRVNRISNEWANIVAEALGEPPAELDEIKHFTPPFTRAKLCEGLSLQFIPYHEWGEGFSAAEHFCSYPWRQLAILVDGQATACCVDAEGEICLGNARTQTVEEIWNGPELSRIRDAFWNNLTAVEARCIRCPIRHWDVEAKYRTHPHRHVATDSADAIPFQYRRPSVQS